MGKINAAWHQANPMPRKPTLDERVRWHLDHRKHCECRSELPATIRRELARRASARK